MGHSCQRPDVYSELLKITHRINPLLPLVAGVMNVIYRNGYFQPILYWSVRCTLYAARPVWLAGPLSQCSTPAELTKVLYFCASSMFFLLSFLSMLSITLAEDSLGSCQFSRDCQTYRQCQQIADASCVCNFGKCVITGNPFFRGTECSEYTDCACK